MIRHAKHKRTKLAQEVHVHGAPTHGLNKAVGADQLRAQHQQHDFFQRVQNFTQSPWVFEPGKGVQPRNALRLRRHGLSSPARGSLSGFTYSSVRESPQSLEWFNRVPCPLHGSALIGPATDGRGLAGRAAGMAGVSV